MLSLPLVTALLTLNLAMGILNRASPQFSIFAVGFPLTLLAGIVMLELLMPRLGAFLEPRFAEVHCEHAAVHAGAAALRTVVRPCGGQALAPTIPSGQCRNFNLAGS
jgi:hypothetical protein